MMIPSSSATDTKFRDLATRQQEAIAYYENDAARLIRKKQKGPLLPDDEKRLTRVQALLSLAQRGHAIDRIFVAARVAFNDRKTAGLLKHILLDPVEGQLRGAPKKTETTAYRTGARDRRTLEGGARHHTVADDPAPHQNGTSLGRADAVSVAHVLGILAADKVDAPRLKVDTGGAAEGVDPTLSSVVSDTADRRYPKFINAFYAALGEARGSEELAALVLPILENEGDADRTDAKAGEVDTAEFARVMRALVDKGVTADEPQLRRRVNEALDGIQSVGREGSIPDMSISLPDLNEITEYQIQSENVEAMGPIICAAMFDELKAFDVVDKLVELWQHGMLPIGVSDAGRMLYEYWKSAPNRMSEAERRNFYAITMGIPGGSVNGAANREFNDLWVRFVSAVSSLVRQRTTDALLRSAIPASVNQQQVRKSARDLSLNLSRHAYGMVNYAARDLQDQIRKMIDLLSHRDIRNAYGAHDMWQVIDQVAALELGGARNSARYRTLATCGAIITKWLSQNIQRFNSATTLRQVLDIEAVLSAEPPSAGRNATRKPTDYDLVNACELWRLDTAMSDDRIEEMAQPRESPAMTSKPVPIPSIARDILDQALPPGIGLGHGMTTVRH